MKGTTDLRPRHYLALDLGATSGRAILGTLQEGRLSLEEIHRFPNGPIERKGNRYWDLPRILSEVEIALAKAFDHSKELDGLACDSWGVDHGFADRDGNLFELPFSYQDPRTQAIQDFPPLKGSLERIFQRTAAPSIGLSTLGQLMATRRDCPELWKRADRFLFIPDWVHHHLTGESIAEKTMASTSQLVSWETLDWDWDLIEELGLPRTLFPNLGESGDRIGQLKPDLASKAGGSPCPVFLPGCHDTASAFIAAPCVDEETVVISAGTWSMVGMKTEKPVLSREVFEAVGGTYALPGKRWTLMRGIMGLWLLDRYKAEEGLSSLHELVDLAERAEPLACLIDPENPLFQERTPIAQVLRIWSKATDQPSPEDAGAVTRTLLESLALFNCETVDWIGRMTGRAAKRIVMVGGGARNELLNQMTADASGLEVVMGPSETTAIGNILAQAVGNGDLSGFSEIRGIVESSFPLKTFEPTDSGPWAEAKEKYHSLKSVRFDPVSTNTRR